jgi:glycosyltransferase involved in cell wall biosynthesis
MKISIFPRFDTPDRGEGGIRRVVEAQYKYLPNLGFKIVDSIEEADLIITHGVYPLEHKLDKPWVYHCHGAYWNDYDWHKWNLAANKTVVNCAIHANIATSPSEWVARILRRGLWIESPVLYSGIEPTEWTPGNKIYPYVLWNKTRVDPVCETDSLNELAKQAEDVRFVSTFGRVTNNVNITGKLPYEQAKEHIQNASVYLATSRETFGIGTLEAMACEVPILGWAWGGQREIVTHLEHGYLATPGDIKDLLKGLYYCLENRERLGKAAREHVLANYTWSKVIKAYADVYRKAIPISSEQPKPKVSIIITCYKLADLLPRAVASVKANDFTDYEIIVVDDCSPDNTREVAENLGVVYTRTPKNLHVSGALNHGMHLARGKYILSLDADNELASNALQVLSEALDADENLDIAYGAMEVAESDGRKFISQWPSEFNYKRQISGHNQITSTCMFRKYVWERTGGYRRRCRRGEDADLWCRATSIGFTARKVTEAVMFTYYNLETSISHTNPEPNWHEWYPWHKIKYENLTPFGVIRDNIPTYEPAKITVIIPVGPGHEEYVVDAIDSLVAQTYTRWDAIVVNDSGKKLPWIHPFVRVIDSGGLRNPAASRNMGVRASNTQLWLPLDADDFLQPEALSLLAKAWERGTYVYSDWIKSETGEIATTPDYDCKHIVKQLPHPVSALYERAMWEKVGGFDENIDSWEDWDFIIALAAQGYCGKRVPQPLLHYRINAGSRREELYAKREESKKAIADKWHKYVIDGEDLMACGGCNGRRTPVAYANKSVVINNNPQNGDLVLVEFTGEGGTRTWRGPVTATEYRFGADEVHKIRYVYVSDLSMFEARSDEFVVHREGVPDVVDSLLQAAGPVAS